MRNRTSIIFILTICFVFAGGAYVNNKKRDRFPAGKTNLKLGLFPKPIEKHLALLKVQIFSQTEIPSSDEDSVTLIGQVLINQKPTGNLLVSWVLPDDVEVLEGETKKQFESPNLGQIYELRLVVKKFSKSSQKKIVLEAQSLRGENLLGSTGIIVSRPEDTWEPYAPEIKKAAEEQLGIEFKPNRKNGLTSE